MAKWQVIVVGEGVAGLMAAGHAAQLGARTLLLGKTNRPGLKLSITGNGRCNLTNTAELSEFIKRFGPNGRFLRQTFQQFFNTDLVAFFEKLGVQTITESDGCIFPKSQKAQGIVDALVEWNRKNCVKIQLLSPVKHLVVEQGKVAAVCTGKETIETDSVIIATGGASYPSTGSSGDGYLLAESIGHTITHIRPALVPLETAGSIARKLQGVSIVGVIVKVLADGKKKIRSQGDVLFTHFGLSGPVVLSLGKQIIDLLTLGRKVAISIDLLPSLDENQLDEALISRLHSHGKQQFKTILKEFAPARLIDVCLELNSINPEKICSQITSDERKKIKILLKDFRLEITGHRSLREAMVTAGDVDSREVNPRTMESLKVKGLYFAGEVLDIDGDTGGFNLQAAFSTGRLAGISAAKSTTE